jgi:acyl-CoA hydrolase
MTDTMSAYAARIATPAAAVELVKPGAHVFLGTGCATPLSLVEARRPSPPDVELFHFLTSALAEGDAPYETRFRHRAFFVGSDMSPLVRSGAAEYVPISLVQIPELIANGRIRAEGLSHCHGGKREASAAQEFSGCCDGGSPRVHRHSAKFAVRLG